MGVLGDGDQLAQDVGTAQRVGITVDGVGGQGVGDQSADEGGQNSQVVQRLPASLGVDAVEGDQMGAHPVQPVQQARHPLVGVRDRGSGQMSLDLGLEASQPVIGTVQHADDGTGGYRQGEQ